MKRRLFTLFLAVVMVLSLFPGLSQTAEAYGIFNLWVGGVQVDTANQNDILGDGTARFDSSTNTLWLDDANITEYYTNNNGNNYQILSELSDTLTIRGSGTIGNGSTRWSIYAGGSGHLILNGDFTILQGTSEAVSAEKSLTIQGGNLTTGKLNVQQGGINILGGNVTVNGYVRAVGDVVIGNGVQKLDVTNPNGRAVFSTSGTVTVGDQLIITTPEGGLVSGGDIYQSNGTSLALRVVIVPAYDLWVGGVQVTGLNKDDILGDGTVSFDPSTTTLTLDNPTLTGSHGDQYSRDAAIYSELTADLTLEGRGTIGNSSCTYGVYAQFDAEGNGGGLILNGDFHIIEGKYDSILARGDLTVLGGHLVTGSIYGGDNSNINLLGGSIVASNRILAGYHDINVGPGVLLLDVTYPSTGSSALAAKGTINIDPSLEFVIPENQLFKRDGNYTYVYSVSSSGGYSKANHVVISRAFDLWVGGVQVTGANMDDILRNGGKAQYNPDTQELTLNDIWLTGGYPSEGSNAVIYSKMADVILKGKATIDATGHTWGVYAGATSGGYDGELVLDGDFTVTGASAYDLLSYGDLTVQGGNLTCGSMRGYNHDIRINGGTVTATKGIQSDGNIYINNGVKKVDASGTSYAIYAYSKTLSLGDELNIIEPDPANILDGHVYDSATDQVAKHVVIVNPNSFPLEITKQPTDYYGKENSTATFLVEAKGEGLRYQWQVSTNGGKSWSASSVTQAKYAAKLTSDKDGRMVRCIVVDQFGQFAISDPAAMHLATLSITTQPKDYTGKLDSQATFTVAAKGTGTLHYQWEVSTNGGKSWSKSSVTQAKYSAKLTSEKDGRMVRCVVTDDYGNSVTSSAATMRIATLSITTQPVDYSGALDSTAKFTVAAKGSGTLHYQWEVSTNSGKTWSKSSVTSAVYAAKLTAEKDGRMVRCIITDDYGNSVTSKSAAMHIANPLAITAQPKDYTGALNSSATFTVEATGEGLRYQWQVSTSAGATWSQSSVTSAKYVAKLTAEKDSRLVRCVVTDRYGNSVTSDDAAMRIGRILLHAQPVDYMGPLNSTARFTVDAIGDGLSYQWQISTNGGRTWSKSSVTSAVYAAKLTAEKDGRMVRCIVTDAYGNVATSDPATMQVGPSITRQPVDYTGAVNSTARFTVAAAGDGLTYQWQVSTNGGRTWSKSSVTSATYAAKLTAEKDGRLVRCIVTDANGRSVTSDAASMNIK